MSYSRIPPLFLTRALATGVGLLALAATATAQGVAYKYQSYVPGLQVTSSAPAPAPLPGALELSANQLVFSASSSPTPVGSSSTQAVRLTNLGASSVQLAAAPSLSGDAAFGFPPSATTCGAVLAPGAWCDTVVRFSPTSTTVANGMLSFDTSVGPAQVALQGTGLQAQGTLSPASGSSTDFGLVAAGASASRSFVFTNTGTWTASGVVGSVSGSGLALTANTCGSAGSPGTLAAGASCTLTVSYTASAGQSLANASVSVASSAPDSPARLALTGAEESTADVDPYFGQTRLLLHGEGTHGSTVFIDSSLAGTTVAKYGNTQLTTATARFGSGALSFDGAGDYLRADTALDTLTTKTAAWTLEAWVYRTGAHNTVFGISPAGACTGGGCNTFVLFTSQITIAGTNYALASAPALNQWAHLAAAYDGTTMRVFLNGTLVLSQAFTPGSALSSNVLGIGVDFDAGNGGTPGNYFTGQMDDVRVTAGVARYSANFIPPTRSFPDR